MLRDKQFAPMESRNTWSRELPNELIPIPTNPKHGGRKSRPQIDHIMWARRGDDLVFENNRGEMTD